MWSCQRTAVPRTEERSLLCAADTGECCAASRGAEPPVCCQHRRVLCCEQTMWRLPTGIWPIRSKIGPFPTRIGAFWTRIRLQPACRPGRPSASILYPNNTPNLNSNSNITIPEPEPGTYRSHCVSSDAGSQRLALPQNLTLLPLYIMAARKLPVFQALTVVHCTCV